MITILWKQIMLKLSVLLQKKLENSHTKRFTKESRETLNNLILFSADHLSQALKKIEKYHNNYRPHQGIGNTIPLKHNYPKEPASIEYINCKQMIGGRLYLKS